MDILSFSFDYVALNFDVNMSSSSLINKLKDFDGYPKTLDDYRIRTLGGGAGNLAASIPCCVICHNCYQYVI